MGCRITGQPALRRHHGANFKALEVTHIFPLADQHGVVLIP
jgi:hypothetical protein